VPNGTAKMAVPRKGETPSPRRTTHKEDSPYISVTASDPALNKTPARIIVIEAAQPILAVE